MEKHLEKCTSAIGSELGGRLVSGAQSLAKAGKGASDVAQVCHQWERSIRQQKKT